MAQARQSPERAAEVETNQETQQAPSLPWEIFLEVIDQLLHALVFTNKIKQGANVDFSNDYAIQALKLAQVSKAVFKHVDRVVSVHLTQAVTMQNEAKRRLEHHNVQKCWGRSLNTTAANQAAQAHGQTPFVYNCLPCQALTRRLKLEVARKRSVRVAKNRFDSIQHNLHGLDVDQVVEAMSLLEHVASGAPTEVGDASGDGEGRK